MREFFSDKTFFSTLFKLGMPIALQQLIFSSLNFVSTMMRWRCKAQATCACPPSSASWRQVWAGLNPALVFGQFGLPALGVQGSALASTSARFVECVAFLGLAFGTRSVAGTSLREMLSCLSLPHDHIPIVLAFHPNRPAVTRKNIVQDSILN